MLLSRELQKQSCFWADHRAWKNHCWLGIGTDSTFCSKLTAVKFLTRQPNICRWHGGSKLKFASSSEDCVIHYTWDSKWKQHPEGSSCAECDGPHPQQVRHQRIHHSYALLPPLAPQFASDVNSRHDWSSIWEPSVVVLGPTRLQYHRISPFIIIQDNFQ